jgi:hypothetical protein
MKEQFIKFLNKTKSYDAFISALINNNKQFDDFIASSCSINYINGAFVWADDKVNGDKYWINLDNRWTKIVSNGEKNN